MRKDSVQPRKRKQPAQGRRRKRKVVRGAKGKENREAGLVLGTLLHTYSKGSTDSLPTPGDKENDTDKTKKTTRTLPAYETYQKAAVKTDLDFLEEEQEEVEENKYKWPSVAYDLATVKTEDSEVPERCVAPLDVSRGMRDYSCSHATCRHLQFSCLDGPSSVREHMKLYH